MMAAKKLRIMREEEETLEQNPKKVKAEQLKRCKEEFIEKGIYSALYGLVERKVKCASMCIDHVLNQRREKLRKLLLAEDENYAKEYIAMCQAANAARDAEMQRRASEVKARQEREQRKLAEEKIRELKMQNCEPARLMKSKKTLELVKQDQMWQIKEKYAIQEAKREEERMYHDLMMRNLLDMKERDEENAKIQWMKRKETKETFIEQMRWKRMKDHQEREYKMEFERRQAEEAERRYKETTEKEIQARKKRNAERIAEYKEFMSREKEIRERRQKEEEEINQAFTKLMRMEEEKEKQMIGSNKETLKREMNSYLESCREIQRLKDLEEKKSNQLIEELSSAIKAQQDANRAKLKAAKQELFNNVMKERAEQVKEKKERERREEEARNNEIELLNLQIEQQRKIREEYERRCTEKRQEYGKQLKKQIAEFEELKKRKKEEDEEYIRQMTLREERQRKELDDIIKCSLDLPMHPMKELIVTQPPRYDRGLPCPR